MHTHARALLSELHDLTVWGRRRVDGVGASSNSSWFLLPALTVTLIILGRVTVTPAKRGPASGRPGRYLTGSLRSDPSPNCPTRLARSESLAGQAAVPGPVRDESDALADSDSVSERH